MTRSILEQVTAVSGAVTSVSSPRLTDISHPGGLFGQCGSYGRILNRAVKDISGSWYCAGVREGRATVEVFGRLGELEPATDELLPWLAGIFAPRLDVRIDSEGGLAPQGLAVYTALREHPAQVTAYVDGAASSIASVVAMAADRVVMARGATMMVHDVYTEGHGSRLRMAAHRFLAEQESEQIAAIYAGRAGGEAALWRERMRAETRYSAEEAVQAGLADEVVGLAAAQAPVRRQPASHDQLLANLLM